MAKDWTAGEIRRVGYRVIDLIADHLTELPDRPVFQPVPPTIQQQFVSSPVPEAGASPDDILREFQDAIEPFPFGNGHPRFSAWVNSPPAVMGIFAEALAAAQRFQKAGGQMRQVQSTASGDFARLNQALSGAERALLIPQGLPNRPWFRHVIYAPGEYTGYAAVVIPGVNEAIDAKDTQLAIGQLATLAEALNRAATVLERYTAVARNAALQKAGSAAQ